MPKKTVRRDRVLQLRLSEGEHTMFVDVARAAGLSTSTWVRSVALGQVLAMGGKAGLPLDIHHMPSIIAALEGRGAKTRRAATVGSAGSSRKIRR